MTEDEYCVIHDLASVRAMITIFTDAGLLVSSEIDKDELIEVVTYMRDWRVQLGRKVEKMMEEGAEDE